MTRHNHTWVAAPDWEWGPGTVTFECIACRGLMVVPQIPEPSSGARERRAVEPPSRSVSGSAGRSRPTAGDQAPRALHE